MFMGDFMARSSLCRNVSRCLGDTEELGDLCRMDVQSDRRISVCGAANSLEEDP